MNFERPEQLLCEHLQPACSRGEILCESVTSFRDFLWTQRSVTRVQVLRRWHDVRS
jgi:hypothetical protein